MRDGFEVVAELSPTQSIQGLAKWTDSDPYAKTLQLFRSKHPKIHFHKYPMFWSQSARKSAIIASPNPFF